MPRSRGFPMRKFPSVQWQSWRCSLGHHTMGAGGREKANFRKEQDSWLMVVLICSLPALAGKPSKPCLKLKLPSYVKAVLVKSVTSTAMHGNLQYSLDSSDGCGTGVHLHAILKENQAGAFQPHMPRWIPVWETQPGAVGCCLHSWPIPQLIKRPCTW